MKIGVDLQLYETMQRPLQRKGRQALKMTTEQYAKIIAGKVAHTARNIAKKGGRQEEADSDVAAAMIITFAQEMMQIMNQVNQMNGEPTILHQEETYERLTIVKEVIRERDPTLTSRHTT